MVSDTSDTPTHARKPPAKDGWRDIFLAALRQHGSISHACKLAGVHRSTAYRHRDQDETFAAAWDQAENEAIDALELEARRRALDRSDRLLIFLLQAHRPEKYARKQQLQHAGEVGARGLTLSQLVALASEEETANR